MKDKIKSLFRSFHTWQLFLFSVIGAVLITDLVTALVSLRIWHEINVNLILLGTINATLVPLIILPIVIRSLRRVVTLEEQNRSHVEMISQLESQHQMQAAVQRRANEMALLYRLGVSLASGKNLYDTLLALQTEIIKFIQADAFYVAFYDEKTDIVKYPILFNEGKPLPEESRLLHEWPGLTGAVIFSGKTLYLADMHDPDVVETYHPHDTVGLVLRTFLGIPLRVDGRFLGMLSVQSKVVDAYTADQIQLMESIAIQAAIAIDKANLLDRVNQELAERKHAEAQIHEREAILEATTFAAEQFLKSPDWRSNMDIVLERLGKTLKATHAYIFEDHLNSQGEPVTSMRYEWTASGYPSDLDSLYFQNAPIHKEGYEDQVAALMRGDVRVGNSSTFTPIEKENMHEFGVKSILEVPIIVNESIWGAIGFDDFEQKRSWSNGEVDSLKIAAGILSAAIQREKAESAVRKSERIYRQAIEAAGAVPYYQDHKINNYQFIGQGIQKITGYSPDEMSLSLWSSILQEEELVGELAGLDVDETARRVRNGELSYWRCDVRILTKDGQSKWITDSAIELFDESGISYGSIGIMQDITERKFTEANLRQREAILQAVTFAAEQFLKTSDWRTNINKVLERLGKSMGATHAYLFEHHIELDGIEYASLRYEWTAPGYPSDLDNPLLQNAHIVREGVDSTDDRLRKGEAFVGNAANFPEVERERLNELGVKALVEVPLFVNGVWWGTIGFDDMAIERNWSPAEVDALKIAAEILSAAIQRQKADSTVRESERIYRQAIEAAGAVPYYQDYKFDTYQFMGQGIQKITGYAPDEMSASLWNSIVQEHEMIGDLAGLDIDIDEAARRVRLGEFDYWKCDYRIQARDGQSKWIADSAIELFDDSGVSYASIGIMQDITERKQIEANLRQREAILEAITFSAEQFLNASNWRERIDIVLEKLGREFNASHAYLFEKYEDLHGELLSSMTYEWTAPGCTSDLGDPEYQDHPVNPSGVLKRVYDILDRGEPLVGSTSFFNQAERKYYMETINIKALLEMRIVVDGNQWGTIGFDDIVSEREWTPMEVDVIKVAANVLGAAIKRQMDEAALQKELDERKRAEQALRFSEEKFSKAFQSTQVMMTIEGTDHLFIDANRAFIDGFGFEMDQVIGHSASDLNMFYDPEDARRLRQVFQEKGFLKDFETRFRRKSGETGFILLSSESFYVDNVEYTLTSGLDITERKRAEENYRNIFNNSIDGIFQSTDEGHFITVNPAMARIYGYDSPEDMLRNVNDISIQVYVDAEQRREVRQRLASGERLIGYETLEYRKDRSTFWSSMTVQAVRDENGKVLYYEGSVEDVTPRKQVEMERERLIADLEAKNTELERFTYTVSHDLKSPLVTINGFLGYLEQDAVSGNVERLKKDSQRIQEAVNKMQQLLNELLELSRIGRIMSVPETVTFDYLVREAMEIVQGRLNERNVTVQIQSDLPIVSVDKPRVIEVLQNLFDNAAKYMGDQPNPLIEIGQKGEDVERGQPVFYVKDNGMGIAPEFHERVFGLFNKLDPRSEGTGVGLALVKRIIEVHGGKIWIESEF